MNTAGRLYLGNVSHRRHVAPFYRFRYRLASVLVDIDSLDRQLQGLRLFSRNRFNLYSLHDADHGPKDGTPWRPWIEGILADAGITLEGGRVLLLCTPRVLGYGFNPLSLWYCHHADGGLRAILCEVRNTFGEWHGYVLHQNGAALEHSPICAEAVKRFHVSPFFPVSGDYRFRLTAPGDNVTVSVRLLQDASPRLTAVQQQRAHPLTDAHLLRAALSYPLMPFKVIVAIHWQALKLWIRGARFHRKPPPPEETVS
ncbi:MAG: DUF1365 domain-containing protein [Ectothiorhodospiraceae bacterium]|nr:DUF1365 domain-containing protein [Ectothiorhodospiraceae bacterium]